MKQARYLARKICEQKSIKPTKKPRYQQAKQAEPDNLIIGMMPRTWRSGSGPCSKKHYITKTFPKLDLLQTSEGQSVFLDREKCDEFDKDCSGKPRCG